jgi:hypothetical protein
MTTHLTWSIENDADIHKECGGKIVLVTAFHQMVVHSEDPEFKDVDMVEVDEEISGHFCMGCRTLVSLSLNT